MIKHHLMIAILAGGIVPLAAQSLHHIIPLGSSESSAPLDLKDSGFISVLSSTSLTTSASVFSNQSITEYNIGLHGGIYLSPAGQAFSKPDKLTESGLVSGHSQRYAADSSSLGQSVWLANGSTGVTVKVGLESAAYVQPNGFCSNSTFGLTESGGIAGTTLLSNGTDQDAWFFINGNPQTWRIGFPKPNASKQTRVNSVLALTESGYVLGQTAVTLPKKGFSQNTAWVATALDGKTVEVGLKNADHTNPDGLQKNYPADINQGGNVVGKAVQYSKAGSETGYSAWGADGRTGQTGPIGLRGTGYQNSKGVEKTAASFLNNAGQAIGASMRYLSNVESGNAAWSANGFWSIPQRIGLYDVDHTGQGNYQDSRVAGLTESGFATGYSAFYPGGHAYGTSAWVANLQTGVSMVIGLPEKSMAESAFVTDTISHCTESGFISGFTPLPYGLHSLPRNYSWIADGHTGQTYSAGGGTTSTVLALTEMGFAAGDWQSYIYIYPTHLYGVLVNGVWFMDGHNGENIQLALTDAEHTGKFLGPDVPPNITTQISSFTKLTESGYVAGWSAIYNGGYASLGQDAWVYDSRHQTTYVIRLATAVDGKASSQIMDINENGQAVGVYSVYDDAGNYVGRRLFAWMPGTGAFDLSDAATPPLSDQGWAALNSAIKINRAGSIIGTGVRVGETAERAFAAQVFEDP